jgi:hypothetical protein
MLTRIILSFTPLLLLVFTAFYFTKPVFAANCAIEFNPTPSDQMSTLAVTVKSGSLSNGSYRIILYTPSLPNGTFFRDVTLSGGEVTAQFNTPSSGWEQGNYKATFRQRAASSSPECEESFTISPSSQNTCQLKIGNTSTIDPNTPITLNIDGTLPESIDRFGDGGYDVLVDNHQKQVYSGGGGGSITIGPYPGTANGVQSYDVRLVPRCGRANPGCSSSKLQDVCQPVQFNVCSTNQDCSNVPISKELKVGEVQKGTAQSPLCKPDPNDPNKTNCTSAAGKFCKSGEELKTAIGCIPTDPQGLVMAVLKIVLGISGALALLFMIFGSFRMITSAGSPEALKAGKDQFSSAVIGLLFIIFSVLLLQILGADILNIPGFVGR